ncbi:hypothetical protein [Qipengyuania sp.]
MDSDELISIAEKLEAGAFEDNVRFRFRHIVHSDGMIEIEGDQGGLREFAGQILRLIAKPYVDGAHIHFDEAASSDQGSQPMIVSRKEGSGDQ